MSSKKQSLTQHKFLSEKELYLHQKELFANRLKVVDGKLVYQWIIA